MYERQIAVLTEGLITSLEQMSVYRGAYNSTEALKNFQKVYDHQLDPVFAGIAKDFRLEFDDYFAADMFTGAFAVFEENRRPFSRATILETLAETNLVRNFRALVAVIGSLPAPRLEIPAEEGCCDPVLPQNFQAAPQVRSRPKEGFWREVSKAAKPNDAGEILRPASAPV